MSRKKGIHKSDAFNSKIVKSINPENICKKQISSSLINNTIVIELYQLHFPTCELPTLKFLFVFFYNITKKGVK